MESPMIAEIVWCPNNFIGNSSPPRVATSYKLQHQRSDTNGTIGVALINDSGRFSGWIARVNLQMVQTLLSDVADTIATVVETKEFDWEKGGGKCWRGRVKLFSDIEGIKKDEK